MSLDEKRGEKSTEQSYNSSQISVNPDVDNAMYPQIQDLEKGEKYMETESEKLAEIDRLVSHYRTQTTTY